MTNEAVGKLVVSEILTFLIGITVSRFRRIEKRQTDCVVVGLIPSIFTVVENSYSIIARTVCKVGPFMRIYFVAVVAVVATFYTSQTDIVSRFLITYVERELYLQQCIERTPVYFVVEVDAVGLTSLIQTNVLVDL